MFNLAFEIGFDHFRFSLPLEISRFQDYYREDIRNGFEAAKYQQVSKKDSTCLKKITLYSR